MMNVNFFEADVLDLSYESRLSVFTAYEMGCQDHLSRDGDCILGHYALCNPD